MGEAGRRVGGRDVACRCAGPGQPGSAATPLTRLHYESQAESTSESAQSDSVCATVMPRAASAAHTTVEQVEIASDTHAYNYGYVLLSHFDAYSYCCLCHMLAVLALRSAV